VLEVEAAAVVAGALVRAEFSAGGVSAGRPLQAMLIDAMYAQCGLHIASIYHAEALFHTFACRLAAASSAFASRK
jgi:hypothetical protein